ncbi:MAG TPA: DUF433 domain-containing protein [Gemmataceae bacterium]|nr:DUF433 domain-containing protein [Gemmataceae bacterium]
MTLPDFLYQGSLGEIRFVGSRIDLYFVISAYKDGKPAEQIAEQYPTLPIAVIGRAVEFYRQNTAAVDVYVRGVQAEIDHLEATSPRVDLDRLRERAARKAALVPPNVEG